VICRDANVSPQAGARITVEADRRTPLRRIWRYIGYDEPNYTYTHSGRALLSKLGSMADAPFCVRCHFLLCSGNGTGRPKWGSTNAYTEDADGRAVYSWDVVDRLLDTYIETGCVPFIEIGFMPRALSSAPAQLLYDDPRRGGWRFPPKDYSRWMDLVRALAAHCLSRYGLREVSRWYWELWNEPDIFYWQGTVEEYCRLYDYTVAGLLSAIPQARVGGPATTSPGNSKAGAFLRAFLEHCTSGTNAVTCQRGTRLDYVSFHSKGGGYGTEPDAPKVTPTIHTLTRHVMAGLAIVGDFAELRKHEVILSECDPDGWAAGSIRENPNLFYRNTEYYASYVACAACKLIDLEDQHGPRVDGMLTWAFQFEGREFFAGLRTLSTNGIDKPVLNVFRMLARLGGTRLRLVSDHARDTLSRDGADESDTLPDISGIAAIDSSDEIQIFLVSHHDDWDVRQSTRVSVCLTGLSGARRYVAWGEMVDAVQGNAHSAWARMGNPQPSNQAQYAKLVEASQLKTEEIGTVEVESGQCELSVTLPAHSVCLLRLCPG
jgi:xylan 1,4-beta-xylosidase